MSPNVLPSIDGYSPPSDTFNEFTGHACWLSTVEHISRMSTEAREAAWDRAERFVLENGVTYNAFQEANSDVRPWEIDLFPLIFDETEWDTISAGLTQRTRLLQAIVSDIYGPQELLKSQIIPPEIVYGHPGFERSFVNLPRPDCGDLSLCGFELARSPRGNWYVMADRFDAPVGAGYALENRLAVTRTIPGIVKNAQIHRLAPFFEKLQTHLRATAFRNQDDPRVVLLTGGPSQAGYFEDVFLARYLGYMLVESGDLAVRDDAVFVKTVDGLLAVDVIFNRVRESEIDPLEVTNATGLGVTGLLNAVRQHKVALVNSPGYGIVESPVWMPFLRTLCRTLLGEELQLPSIATWWCGTPKEREHVLDTIEDLVVKPAFEHSGGREFDVASLTGPERQQLVEEIKARPYDFVAQEKIKRSACPTWRRGDIGSGHVAIRTFVTANDVTSSSQVTDIAHGKPSDPFRVMPGALVRVADKPSPLQLSINAGHSSKDAWVSSARPVKHTTLLTGTSANLSPRRNAHLVPCRVADNLFWFGRTLDSVDFLARLLRAVVVRVESDRPTEDFQEVPPLLRALTGQGLIDAGYCVESLERSLPPLEDAIVATIADTTESTSLSGQLRELHRLASHLRDRLSPDTWQAIRDIDRLSGSNETQNLAPEEVADVLDDIIVGLASCSGLITDGTVRGIGWRFCNMGRRIGRAERTMEFLRDIWPRVLNDERSVLDAVLDVMDGRITYRSRYLADVHPVLVLDLVLFDETNPRSVAYQLTRLSDSIDTLPRDVSSVGLSSTQKVIRRAVSQLQQTNVQDLIQTVETNDTGRAALKKLLAEQLDHMKAVSSELTRNYLVLSRSARSREDGPIRLL